MTLYAQAALMLQACKQEGAAAGQGIPLHRQRDGGCTHPFASMDDVYKVLQLLMCDGWCDRRCRREARWSRNRAAAVICILIGSFTFFCW